MKGEGEKGPIHRDSRRRYKSRDNRGERGLKKKIMREETGEW